MGMWIGRVTGLVGVLLVGGCGLPQPLCQRAEVLQEVGRVVRGWNEYNAIDEYSVREAPTGRGNVVACQADMTSVAYQPEGDGYRAVPYREVRRYGVRVTGANFEVSVPR